MYSDRRDAGRQLAPHLAHLKGAGTVVLGLPRGGVPVAAEVATALGAPLDVILVRKLGVPFQPELAWGAIGEGGVRVINPDVLRMAHVSEPEMASVERRERASLEHRARLFRAGRPPRPLAGSTAVVVDDGLATGATAMAACEVARAHGATRVVLAVPVGPPECERRFHDRVDEVVCPWQPQGFAAIGQFYRDFRQVSDQEVVDLLARAAAAETGQTPAAGSAASGTAPVHVGPSDEEVRIPAAGVELPGRLTIPDGARGVVLFAHGSGSSRHSPRNRYVADVLHRAGLGTLLFDLLTAREEGDRSLVFDIDLLSGRLGDATEWVRKQPAAAGLPIGIFGASTGAAAALWAAADLPETVAAVVSRGGRPDLALPRLHEVRAPTLLVVGGYDGVVLDLNRRAQQYLECENRLSVVPGATHLFEEPGTLAEAAGLARDWFSEHLVPDAPS